eukprot:TRINITY_DN88_c0_g2_i1.p1 TRINITY_DN88_c0_g2~~TRINITY_DN88_c0_g2_i1.p1  ORF type:complete len:458 (+),score=135.03 TRINITY_DN88_c0_g2_i1:69-1442(+)
MATTTKALFGLRCTLCGERYAEGGDVYYACPKHPEGTGILDVEYDYAQVKARLVGKQPSADRYGMWRYRALLPVPAEPTLDALIDAHTVPALKVGNTPLLRVVNPSGCRELWIKDDGRNPTASLKDRASALVIAKAKLEKRAIVSTASTGNAAAALAGLCASAKQRCVIFVPHTIPDAKRTQLVMYGADVVLVKGTYDNAFDVCMHACKKFGWYCRNTGYNPYTAEGKKTVSYEICEQLHACHHDSNCEGELHFESPDAVFVSVGDGNIVSGVHKGFKDLLALGLIEKMPKIFGVQSTGSPAIANAWRDKVDLRTKPDDMLLQPIECDTIADSIAAGLPRDPIRAARAARETNGQYILVEDADILAAMPAMARSTGVFAEPASATAYAGFLKAQQQKLLGSDEVVVVLSTGNGLKDIVSANRAVAKEMASVLSVPILSPETADETCHTLEKAFIAKL